MLLHFSVAVSRLSDQSKVLAQRLALLEERMRRQEAASDGRPRTTRTQEFAEVGPARRGARSAGRGKP